MPNRPMDAGSAVVETNLHAPPFAAMSAQSLLGQPESPQPRDGPRTPSDGFYREMAPVPELRSHVKCIWYHRVRASRELAIEAVRVLPDGCIDIVWLNGQLRVVGPDKKVRMAQLPVGTTIAGLRFRPGVAPVALGVPANALVNHRVPLGDLWNSDVDPIEDQLHEAHSLQEATDHLQSVVLYRLRRAPQVDQLVQRLVVAIEGGLGGRRRSIAHVADSFGIGERQLLRRCESAIGYGPKTLERILRLQRFLTLAQHAPLGSLTRVARDLGYADQPHMTRDIVRIAGVPPSALVADRRV